MEHRHLGRSGLRVPVLSLGTMTFGGRGNFAAVGDTDAGGAARQIDMALDAGVNLVDTADVYSAGLSEEIIGEVLDAGKVRYVGCSNYTGWQLMKAVGVSERHGFERFVSQQIHYSLQAREAEYEIVPAGLDQGVGIMVWSPLAGGLLSGKYRRGEAGPEGSRGLTDWNEPPVRDPDALYDIVDVLLEIAEGRGVSAAQVAIAWLLGRPGVATVVIGARTDEQLADNLAAADLELSDEERARLDEVSAPPLLYPHWHQAKTARDRLGEPELTLLGPHVG